MAATKTDVEMGRSGGNAPSTARLTDLFKLRDTKFTDWYKGQTELSASPQEIEEAKQRETEAGRFILCKLGGPEGVGKDLGSEFDKDGIPRGLPEARVQKNKEDYGENVIPTPPMQGLFSHWLEALSDPTLIVLCVVALIQIIICIVEVASGNVKECESPSMQLCIRNQVHLREISTPLFNRDLDPTKMNAAAIALKGIIPEPEYASQDIMRTEYYNDLAECYFNSEQPTTKWPTTKTGDYSALRANCHAQFKEIGYLGSPNSTLKVNYRDGFDSILNDTRRCASKSSAVTRANCRNKYTLRNGPDITVCSELADCIGGTLALIDPEVLLQSIANVNDQRLMNATRALLAMLAHFDSVPNIGSIEKCRVWHTEGSCDQEGNCMKADHKADLICLLDGGAIIITVLIVSSLGAWNNYSSAGEFAKLSATEKSSVKYFAVRGGTEVQIGVEEIVVGDILSLRTGDKVPADGFCLESKDCEVDQSVMTGEPDLIKKKSWNDTYNSEKGKASDTWLISGTDIKAGSASMVVTGTGVNTEWGETMSKMQVEDDPTPLQEKLVVMAEDIGKAGTVMAILTFLALILIFLINDLAVVGYVCPSGIAVFGTICHFVIIAVTIVVVAVPEGLPLAVTIALSYSMKEMLADNVLVRKLQACETMGGATNICTDKTGTLTQNKMSVVQGWFSGKDITVTTPAYSPSALAKEVIDANGNSYAELLMKAISMNSDANLKNPAPEAKDRNFVFMGNPTECAMLVLVEHLKPNRDEKTEPDFRYQTYRQQLETDKKKRTVPFSSKKKRMSTISEGMLYCKGASEMVLKDCTTYLDVSSGKLERTPLDDALRLKIEKKIGDMAKSGLRTICVAYRDVSTENWSEKDADGVYLVPEDQLERELTCIGVVGIKDPIRATVPEAVQKCQTAGITVRMVTGDNIDTATFIAVECGILPQEYLKVVNDFDTKRQELKDLEKNKTDAAQGLTEKLTKEVADLSKKLDKVRIEGPSFRLLSQGEMTSRLQNGLVVMARSAPSDKEIMVRRLKALGETVAVTGDGTNDAPALKAAHVGMSMGIAGTTVAKEASNLVILDDDFSSIVKACKWGRNVFDAVRKFLQFQLTVNIVAVSLVFIAAVTRHEPPLTAVQLLWVNMIMDSFGALALATEMPTDELLKRPPVKQSDPLINRPMWRNILFQAAYQLTICLILLYSGQSFVPVGLGQVESYRTGTPEVIADEQRKVCGYFLKQHNGFRNTECEDKGFKFYQPEWPTRQLYIADMVPAEHATTLINTVIFNTFVCMQIFNSMNARRIDTVNIFERINTHWLFLIVTLIEIGLQVMLIHVPGMNNAFKCVSLNGPQWGICLVIGACSLVLGVIQHLTKFSMCQESASVSDADTKEREYLVEILKKAEMEEPPDSLVDALVNWKAGKIELDEPHADDAKPDGADDANPKSTNC